MKQPAIDKILKEMDRFYTNVARMPDKIQVSPSLNKHLELEAGQLLTMERSLTTINGVPLEVKYILPGLMFSLVARDFDTNQLPNGLIKTSEVTYTMIGTVEE